MKLFHFFNAKNSLIYIFILILAFPINMIIATYSPISHFTTATKGSRSSMEDTHFPDIKPDGSEQSPCITDSSFFYGVYDGHGGRNAAAYCAKHLHTIIHTHSEFDSNPTSALNQSFTLVHEHYRNSSDEVEPKDGTTAIVALFKGNQLFVANAGDARAVICTTKLDAYGELQNKALRLSCDHKPNETTERARIEKTQCSKSNISGFILEHGKFPLRYLVNFCPVLGISIIEEQIQTIYRTCGMLSIARAIGDFSFAPFIIPTPFVQQYNLSGNEKFLILACDGFWDVVSDQAAIDLVLYYIAQLKAQARTTQEELPPEIITEIVSGKLVDKALELGSTDNITVTLILLPEYKKIEPLENYTPAKTSTQASSANLLDL